MKREEDFTERKNKAKIFEIVDVLSEVFLEGGTSKLMREPGFPYCRGQTGQV